MPTTEFLERVDSYISGQRSRVYSTAKVCECMSYSLRTKKLLDERLRQVRQTFPQYLLQFIAERGLDEVEVYKRANLDRRIFSKLRNGANYMPSKRTVLLIALAMELPLDEVEDLLYRAGYALSEYSRKDVIIQFFFEERIYDLFLLNETLDHYGYKPL